VLANRHSCEAYHDSHPAHKRNLHYSGATEDIVPQDIRKAGTSMMTVPHPRQRGVTLIELMITLAVAAIILAFAIPSFLDFRQRAALRGAADQVSNFWGEARFEALRRNSLVAVHLQSDVNGRICLGAATTTDPATNVGCDCFTAAACNVARYPSEQSNWRGVRVAANPTIGNDDGDLSAVVVIDPKRGNITEATDAGMFLLRSPEGGREDYRLNVSIDRNGRALLCEPAAAPSKLPQYIERRC
jgi:prepilin-type N-terminal cleavage/methylation domain-containing protein